MQRDRVLDAAYVLRGRRATHAEPEESDCEIKKDQEECSTQGEVGGADDGHVVYPVDRVLAHFILSMREPMITSLTGTLASGKAPVSSQLTYAKRIPHKQMCIVRAIAEPSGSPR